MKPEDGLQPDRLIRLLAVVAGSAILIVFALTALKLVASLQASSSSVNTSEVAIAVLVLCGLALAGLIARHIFVRGVVGVRQIKALLTETASGQIVCGLAGVVLAGGALSGLASTNDWVSGLLSGLLAMFWLAIGLRWLRNGWRQLARHRDTSHHGPDIERILE